VNRVREFETGLLSLLRSDRKGLLDSIRTEAQLTDPIRAELKSTLDQYAKNFA
jgi:F-type H+-transporting ATPase subunit alpha